MSVHYLIDPFTDNGDIIDVRVPEAGQTEATGSTIIRLPSGVSVSTKPSTSSELITAKYDAILAANPGFTTIVADACMDSTTFDVDASAGGASVNTRFSDGWLHHVIPPNALCEINAIDVTPDVPSQCLVLWEEYTFDDVDDKTGRFQRTYVEESGNNLSVGVTFDGSPGFFNHNFGVQNGAVVNLTGWTGSSLIVSFVNSSSNTIHLGSWAVIY